MGMLSRSISAFLIVLASATAADPGSHWAFRRIERPAAPRVKTQGWVRNAIDRFVLARLEKEGLIPSPEASSEVLTRRLYLDLVGLPPTRPMSGAQVPVSTLLASPHFGEKWARHWLDLARYADSDGYEKDWVRPHAWRYRDWVIRALNANMPFDRFSIAQIAGDQIPNASLQDRIATGFHRQTLTNREGGVDSEQFRFEAAIDRSATTAQVFMGLTAGCAQCHDHKYDPISQKDFYRWTALFENLTEEDIDAPLPGEPGPNLRAMAGYRERRNALLAEYNVPALQTDWEQKLLTAAAQPGRWTDLDLAYDCVQKLTVGGDGEAILRKPPGNRTLREADILTDHFVRNYHFAIGGKKYKELKFSELDQKLTALKQEFPQLSIAYVVQESATPRPSHVRVRGDYRNRGVAVEPGTFSFLPASTAKTRLDAARWLFSREHPLTARVAVNRIWQELFGQGLVRTPEDFGLQGERPSHPELLDWLAAEFIESGWDIKHTIALIVDSATYRQSSNASAQLLERDPNNVLLARQRRLRLPAELIRDAALEAAGLLDRRIGGPSIRPPQPAGVAELAYNNSVKWTESAGTDRYRRGLYIHFQRSTPYPLLANFDAPKGAVTTCRRLRSNTALQALNLLNDPVFFEAAQGLALRILREAEPARRIQRLYEVTLHRMPAPAEAQRMEEYLAAQRSIFDREPGSSQKIFPWTLPPGVDRVTAAAWVGAASVILNLDEFISRE